MSRSIDRLRARQAEERLAGFVTYRGVWDPNTAYRTGDSVTYPSATSAFYVALRSSAGDAPDESDAWERRGEAAES